MLPSLMVAVLAVATDPPPSENNVRAGWVALVVVLLLCVAVFFLLRSFTRQLKKVEKADRAGVYDDSPSGSEGAEAPSTPIEQDH